MPFLRYETPTGPRLYELGAKDKVTIGRSHECDIWIDDKMASRVHITVTRLQAGYVMEDLRSKNGTSVNGIPRTSWNLKDGDLIAIGTTKITFKMVK